MPGISRTPRISRTPGISRTIIRNCGLGLGLKVYPGGEQDTVKNGGQGGGRKPGRSPERMLGYSFLLCGIVRDQFVLSYARTAGLVVCLLKITPPH